MQGNLDPVQVGAVDKRSRAVETICGNLEQAGRGILKAAQQLAAGAPQGNELIYLSAAQAYLADAVFEYVQLDIPVKGPETAGPKIALG